MTPLACGVMAGFLLAGCGGFVSRSGISASSRSKEADAAGSVSEETVSSNSDSSDKNVIVGEVENTNQFQGEELRILVSSGWMDNRYDATIRRFEDLYGVTVDVQTIPAGQYADILQSNLVNGTCPDIFWIQSNPVGAIESNIGNPQEYCIDFTGADWQNVMPVSRQASCISDGKLYGLQIWHNSPEYVMVYNKTLFSELGIDEVPVTYSDLKKDLEILKNSGVETPWFMPGADGWQHQLAFFQIGGVYTEGDPDLYDKLNNNTATFAGNDKMLEVLREFKELSDNGYFGEDWIRTDSSGMENAFADRTTGMAMANSSFIRQVKEDTGTSDEFGLFLIPLDDNTWYPTDPAGPTMFGYKGSEHEDLVRAFFQFVCTPQSLQEILDNSAQFTNLDVNVDIEQHWLPEETEFIKSIDSDKMSVPVLQNGTKYTNDYWMNFGADMISFCQGSMSANDVLKNMDAGRAADAEDAGDPAWS